MSTPGAAVESTAIPAGSTPEGRAEVRELLGLDPESADGGDDGGEASAETSGLDENQTDGDDAANDEPKTAKGDADETETETEDDDVATVRAIEARAKARRREVNARRAAAQAKAAPVAVPAPQAAPAPAAQATRSPVETAVKDVLDQIARLAGDDAAAQSANTVAPETASRQAAMAAIEAKLATIEGGLKATDEGKAKLATIEAKLQAIEDERVVRGHVARVVDRLVDDLPTLTDAKALRAYNKEHGTSYADAVEMISKGANNYFEKFKRAPDLAEMAKRIERKLSGKAHESASGEKPTTKSKTVSRKDGSPPAARTGPDQRSYEQAQADFRARFGLD